MKLYFYMVVFLLSLSMVNAFGMASNYLEDKTMYLAPGEIKEYKVELQNNDPVEQKIKFELQSEIATIKNKQEYYLVGGDKIKQDVILIIEAPKNVQIGKEYVVKYSAVPITDSGKPINLNIKFNNEFKVIIRKKDVKLNLENEKNNFGKIPVSVILVLIFLLAVLLIFKKNKALIKRILKK